MSKKSIFRTLDFVFGARSVFFDCEVVIFGRFNGDSVAVYVR